MTRCDPSWEREILQRDDHVNAHGTAVRASYTNTSVRCERRYWTAEGYYCMLWQSSTATSLSLGFRMSSSRTAPLSACAHAIRAICVRVCSVCLWSSGCNSRFIARTERRHACMLFGLWLLWKTRIEYSRVGGGSDSLMCWEIISVSNRLYIFIICLDRLAMTCNYV